MKFMKLAGRILLAGFAYLIGLSIMGALAPVLHLPTLRALPGVTPQHTFELALLASPLLSIGLLPLALNLKGSWSQRAEAIAALLFVTLGLNTLIEAKIFTSVLEGSPWLASAQWILPCALTAAALTYRFGDQQETTGVLEEFGTRLVGWRVVLAWLIWPVIYFFFGMCVSPFVVPYYQTSAGALGLHIPAISVIIRTQLLRSALFLAASLPAIMLWTKSRGYLILALGLAHAMTVGIFQLVQAPFLPMVLRVAHSIEITCDSFAYAAVLVLLFARSMKASKPLVQCVAAD